MNKDLEACPCRLVQVQRVRLFHVKHRPLPT
jgi:hypothetical protein